MHRGTSLHTHVVRDTNAIGKDKLGGADAARRGSHAQLVHPKRGLLNRPEQEPRAPHEYSAPCLPQRAVYFGQIAEGPVYKPCCR